ncbi:MAG TPA: hypothetical protein VGU64_13415 [Terriglobales bacterium]|nr:hypothetical protein [Terriglobales bacterium]
MIVTRYAETSLSICCEDFHDLALTPKARQYLDEAVQENIPRHEKEKKKQHRGEKPAGKVSGPGE